MNTILARIRDVRLVRYLLASVGALAADAGFFLVLLGLGLRSAIAAVAGYCLGIAVHWVLSSRAVFADRVAAHGVVRTRQKAMFIASAMIGLALTAAIVMLGESIGSDPRLAKLIAVAVSFVATWLLRSSVVFRATCDG